MQALKRIAAKYSFLLEKYPIPTKCVSTGLLFAAGDLVAQYGEQKHVDAAVSNDHDTIITKRNMFELDTIRFTSFFLFGSVVGGPAFHFWYNWLSGLPAIVRKLPMGRAFLNIDNTEKVTAAKNAFIMVVADTFIFDPLFLGGFYAGVGMLMGVSKHYWEGISEKGFVDDVVLPRSQSQSVSSDGANAMSAQAATHPIAFQDVCGEVWCDTKTHMGEVFWPTYKLEVMIWPPLQIVNFMFVPLKFQVLYVTFFSFLWNAYLSYTACSNKPSDAVEMDNDNADISTNTSIANHSNSSGRTNNSCDSCIR